MASIVYNIFMKKIADKEIDLAADIFSVRLCMTSTRCSEENGRDADTLAAIEALTDGIDMFDGKIDNVDYAIATHDTVLASKVVENDDSGNRMDWSADNVEWEAVTVGARNIDGALIYYEPGSGATEANRIPVCYIEFGTPIETDGSDVKIKWDSGASGGDILRMAQA